MISSSYLSLRCELIEKTLSQLISEHAEMPHSLLFQSARYSLLGPAKRLRPLLTLATAESFGADVKMALHPACALELIHTYSLIHDDLPCMDDDDLRRGKPSLHKVVGEGQAVLTGDYLLTYAFEVLAKSPLLTAEQKIELITILSERAGGDGMVGGQVLDLLSEGQSPDWHTIEFIHHHKTAALISASIEFGAVIAQVSDEDKKHLQSIGYKAGLAFQIVDDILDVTANELELGKPIGSDLDLNKATAVSVLGLEKAQTIANTLRVAIENECKLLSIHDSSLAMVLDQLIDRTA
jgi:geranylgeranyl diphosphate synthase type II